MQAWQPVSFGKASNAALAVFCLHNCFYGQEHIGSLRACCYLPTVCQPVCFLLTCLAASEQVFKFTLKVSIMQTQSFVFNNAVSVSFNEQGYLNAGTVAAKFGKAAKDYLKTQQTQEYITALAEFLSTGRKILVKENQLVTVINGGENRGTWLHPKLAVHFARWLDARFAVWCDMKIEEILGINQQTEKLTPSQKQQIQEAVRSRHHSTGEHWQEIYRKLHAYLKVNSYHEIQAKDFQVALKFLASIENTPERFTEPKLLHFTDEMVQRNSQPIIGAINGMIRYFEQTYHGVKVFNPKLTTSAIEYYKILKIYTPKMN